MVQAVVESDLREVDYGDYEGRTSKDIKSVSPGWSLFRDGSPGGETPLDMTARADRLIARLNTLKGPVALFSHGHFSCVLATRWIGLPVSEAEHFSLSTASLSLLSYSPSHPEVPVIRLWNASPAVLYSG
jgi:probable phosphoglycerate mutase